MFALERQLRMENISSVIIATRMFDTLVTPILTYAAEIWGCFDDHADADKLHLGFLKRILRVPISTDTQTVYAESGCLPMHTRMLECQARYWTRLRKVAAADEGRLISLAFNENMSMMRRASCWCSRSQTAMNMVSSHAWMHAGAMEIRSTMATLIHNALNESIYLSGTDHRDLYTHHSYCHAALARRRTYATWFWSRSMEADKAIEVEDSLLRNALVRFRMGAHGLRVVTAGWTRNGQLQRIHRLCLCCSMGIVEDEFHMVFECSLYQTLRFRYSDLFRDFIMHLGDGRITCQIGDDADGMMRKFFAHANQYTVAKYIKACLCLRDYISSA